MDGSVKRPIVARSAYKDVLGISIKCIGQFLPSYAQTRRWIVGSLAGYLYTGPAVFVKRSDASFPAHCLPSNFNLLL
jgi:hypothetical protein